VRKFRVWSGEYKKYIYDHSYPIGSNHRLVINQEGELCNLGLGDFQGHDYCNHSWGSLRVCSGSDREQDFVVEWSTGVKDNDGNDIYEGDIVTMHRFLFNGTEYEKEVVGTIKYNPEVMGFCLVNCTCRDTRLKGNGIEGSPISSIYGLHERSWNVIGSFHEGIRKGVDNDTFRKS
jgi:uncharacterized phage protein (TIGR01671 family)